MTITDASEVKRILKNGGKDDGFTFAVIYSYCRRGGAERLYALFTDVQYDDMNLSPYVEDVICLMVEGVLTIDGKEFIKDR